MRSSDSLLFLLLFASSLPGAALAQKAAGNPRPLPRSWSEEMRDKAEVSFYQRHDCHAALLQANAAFDREMRHPERMDPRIPLVKARAHACRGELPQAILAYAMHDRLAVVAAGDDPELFGACLALLPDRQPVDSLERARLLDSLTLVRGQIEHARSRNSTELFLRTGSGIDVPPPRPLPAQVRVDMDQGRLTRNMSNEYIRVMRGYWDAPPYISPVTSFNRTFSERAGAAESTLAGALADVEARLLCLDPSR